jgi:hypothetical protein
MDHYRVILNLGRGGIIYHSESRIVCCSDLDQTIYDFVKILTYLERGAIGAIKVEKLRLEEVGVSTVA